MTTITDPASNQVQAIFLRGHLRLMAAGMRNSRISRTDALSKATTITGKNYKNSVAGCTNALNDLGEFVK